jgi:YVTN family beta-propeller protein
MNASPVLAVANVTYCSVDFFDYSTGTNLATLTDLTPQPHELAVDPLGRRLFVSHTYRKGAYGLGSEQSHEITVIDVDSRSVSTVIDIHPFVAPHGVRYVPTTGLLLASVESSPAGRGVVLIDPDKHEVVGHIETVAPNSHWMAVAPSGTHCYVTHKDASMLSVLNLETRTLEATVDLPGGAEEVDISPDGRHLYVVTPHQTTPAPRDHAPSCLLKIDTMSLDTVAALQLTPANSAVHVGAHGLVYVTRMTPTQLEFGSTRGALNVIDAESMTLRGTVELDNESFTMREAPDGQTVCVSNATSNTISVVDLGTLDVARTLHIARRSEAPFSGAHGLAFLP